MKLFLLLSLFISSPIARAQSEAPYTRKYLFLGVSPTDTPQSNTSAGFLPPTLGPLSSTPPTNNWYTGGLGIERLLAKYIGVGVDLAALVPGQGKIVNNTTGVFSPEAYFHWPFGSKLDVFGAAGYSLLFRDFTANYYNLGGGLNYWMGIDENTGLMFQYRRLNPIDSTVKSYASYNEIRFGVTFRRK